MKNSNLWRMSNKNRDAIGEIDGRLREVERGEGERWVRRVEAGNKSEWEVERGRWRSRGKVHLSPPLRLNTSPPLILSFLASWQLSRSQTTICLLERSEQRYTDFSSSSSSLSPSISPPFPPLHETLPLHCDSMWEKENQTEPIDRQDTNTLIC